MAVCRVIRGGFVVYQILMSPATGAGHAKKLTKPRQTGYVFRHRQPASRKKDGSVINQMENSVDNPVLAAIFARRSIRAFTGEAVPLEQLRSIVEAGIWAPSGLNNQPWRFILIQDHETRDELAALTRYRHIMTAAQGLIAVFLDTTTMYDEVKDHQAAGACIQNMLLALESFGLGGVWLGQILANKNRVNELLDVPATLDLMAVIALGHPAHRHQKAERKPLSEFIIKEL